MLSSRTSSSSSCKSMPPTPNSSSNSFDEEPSATREPSADEEPSATRESSADEEPSATREPDANDAGILNVGSASFCFCASLLSSIATDKSRASLPHEVIFIFSPDVKPCRRCRSISSIAFCEKANAEKLIGLPVSST